MLANYQLSYDSKEGPLTGHLLRKVSFTTILSTAVLLCGCMSSEDRSSAEAFASKEAVCNAFGPVVFERTIGNTTYYRHRSGYGDLKAILDPFITIVSDNRLVRHGRISEVITNLVDIEAAHLVPKSQFISIDIYGVALGDKIANYKEITPLAVSDDKQLATCQLTNSHGWDRFILEVSRFGTIDGIELLKKFESSEAMMNFRFVLEKTMSSKFTAFEISSSARSYNFLYTIYGVPNEATFRSTLGTIIKNELAYDKLEYKSFDSIPYLINDGLDRIQVFFDSDRLIGWLSVRSVSYNRRMESINETILEKL